MKRTLVAGASTNPYRYAYLAVKRLLSHGIPVNAVGIRKGSIDNIEIQTNYPIIDNIHTVTLYVGPRNQETWMKYILELHPKRIIFNPGTENPIVQQKALDLGIEVLEACTLVMLSTNNY